MKKITFLSVALLTFAMNAQVTYTSANFATAGEEFTVSKASSYVGLNFATTGANQNWNYSSLQAASQSNSGWQNPNGSGYKLSWCLSNFYIFNCNSQFNNNFTHSTVVTDGFELMDYGVANIVEHSRANASSFANRMRGLTATVNGLSVPMTIDYDDPDEIYQFPMTYNDSYTTTGNLSMDLNNLGVPFSYTLATQRTNNVQGWGSLTTPMGTFPNVLKLKTVLQKTETYTYEGIAIPIPTTTVSYQWFSPEYGIPVLQADGFEVFNIFIPTAVTYLDEPLCLPASAAFAYLPVGNYDPDSQSATVPFINQSTNYSAVSWDFGDGTTSTEAAPSHVYNCAGTYQVTLTVTNATCNPSTTDTFTLPVIVTDTQNALTTAITVADNMLTADRDLPGTTYQWVDCDSANAPINGETAQSFSPSTNGNYACIIDTNGCQSVSDCVAFTLCVAATAEFSAISTADFDLATLGATVSFTNMSTDFSTISWNFGDGSNATDENPSHTFTCPGVYQVAVTVANTNCSANESATFILPIEITDTQNVMTSAVTVTPTGLSANRDLPGTTYQWMDCDNGNSDIADETNQVFTPAVSGNYACRVNTNGCEATSDCMAFTLLATKNFDNGQFELYPNPTTGQLYFTNNAIKVKAIAVYNSLGMHVGNDLEISALSTGVYFVKITAEEGSFVRKVIKQ